MILLVAGCGEELFFWDLSMLMYKLGQNISGSKKKIAEHEGKITFNCLSSYIIHYLQDEALQTWNEPWISFSGT